MITKDVLFVILIVIEIIIALMTPFVVLRTVEITTSRVIYAVLIVWAFMCLTTLAFM